MKLTRLTKRVIPVSKPFIKPSVTVEPDEPIDLKYNINPARLERATFRRYAKAIVSQRAREQRAEEARENFGKKGRDPRTLTDVATNLAQESQWEVGLKLAQLREQWIDVFGDYMGPHASFVSFERGILTVRGDSPAWSQIWQELTPDINRKLKKWFSPITYVTVEVRGVSSRRRAFRGKYGSSVGYSEGSKLKIKGQPRNGGGQPRNGGDQPRNGIGQPYQPGMWG